MAQQNKHSNSSTALSTGNPYTPDTIQNAIRFGGQSLAVVNRDDPYEFDKMIGRFLKRINQLLGTTFNPTQYEAIKSMMLEKGTNRHILNEADLVLVANRMFAHGFEHNTPPAHKIAEILDQYITERIDISASESEGEHFKHKQAEANESFTPEQMERIYNHMRQQPPPPDVKPMDDLRAEYRRATIRHIGEMIQYGKYTDAEIEKLQEVYPELRGDDPNAESDGEGV